MSTTSIRTNIAAERNVRHLTNHHSEAANNMGHLASGSRINYAAEDAAGLSVAEKLDAREGGLRVAFRNANDGVSLVQTAEGGTREVENLLKRLNELCVQGASETLSPDQRAMISKETFAIKEEIDRIARTTEWNGLSPLNDGTGRQISIQVGEQEANSQLSVPMQDVTATSIGINPPVTAEDWMTDPAQARAGLDAVEAALREVHLARAALGAVANRLESTLRNLQNDTEATTAGQSRIRDADFAIETAELTKFQLLTSSGQSLMMQLNTNPQNLLKLIG